jgi:chromosome segregation ATPase
MEVEQLKGEIINKIIELKDVNKDLVKDMNNDKKKIIDLESKITDLENKLKENNTNVDTTDEIEKLKTEINKITSENTKLKNAINNYHTTMNERGIELNNYEQVIKKLKQENEELKKDIEISENEVKDLKQLDKNKISINDENKTPENYEDKLKEKDSHISYLEKQVNELHNNIEELNKQNKQIKRYAISSITSPSLSSWKEPSSTCSLCPTKDKEISQLQNEINKLKNSKQNTTQNMMIVKPQTMPIMSSMMDSRVFSDEPFPNPNESKKENNTKIPTNINDFLKYELQIIE